MEKVQATQENNNLLKIKKGKRVKVVTSQFGLL